MTFFAVPRLMFCVAIGRAFFYRRRTFYGSVYAFFLHLPSVVLILCHVIFALGFAFSPTVMHCHPLASNGLKRSHKQIVIDDVVDHMTTTRASKTSSLSCSHPTSFRKLINPSWTRNNWRNETAKHIALDSGQLSLPGLACAISIDCSEGVSIRKMMMMSTNNSRSFDRPTEWNDETCDAKNIVVTQYESVFLAVCCCNVYVQITSKVFCSRVEYNRRGAKRFVIVGQQEK